MKRYFYITNAFFPIYEETIFLKIDDNLFKEIETGDIFRKRPSYDFGWGQENGYELLPQLTFGELIKLVEQPYLLPKKRFWQKYTEEQIKEYKIWRSNLYGAVSVIMQDYTEEFVNFLYDRVDTDYFLTASIRQNFKSFTFDEQKSRAEGLYLGCIGEQSYEEILNYYSKWREIADRIICQIYG